jgi:hypothetical protein
MTDSQDLLTLARWMAADFTNQKQVFENPPFWSYIRYCMRPLPWEFLGGFSFLLEQSYDYALDQPYRIRVFHLVQVDGQITIKSYRIENQETFYGASRDLDRLATLTPESLVPVGGCDFDVVKKEQIFYGSVKPGKGCIVERNGKTTYLDSSFEVSEEKFVIRDVGRDPETDELVWGSVAGAFVFDRYQSFVDEVPTPPST